MIFYIVDRRSTFFLLHVAIFIMPQGKNTLQSAFFTLHFSLAAAICFSNFVFFFDSNFISDTISVIQMLYICTNLSFLLLQLLFLTLTLRNNITHKCHKVGTPLSQYKVTQHYVEIL